MHEMLDFFNFLNIILEIYLAVFCSDDDSGTGVNAAKLLKVAWMTFPLGILVTLAGCLFVFWWQGLSYSSPYAQAILINGELITQSHASWT